MKLLILGLGNELMSDDGVGVHAARRLTDVGVEGARVEIVGTAVLDALPLLESYDLVLGLDAVKGGSKPGTIYELEVEPAGAVPVSMHDLNLQSALELIAPEQRPRVRILGVEPASLETGMNLSNEVAAVMPDFVRTVVRFADQWIRER